MIFLSFYCSLWLRSLLHDLLELFERQKCKEIFFLKMIIFQESDKSNNDFQVNVL